MEVRQQRLQAVERVGEAGLVRRARLELVPQGAQPSVQVVREEAEHIGRGGLLSSRLVQIGRRVVTKGVARLDLDDVMEQEHL